MGRVPSGAYKRRCPKHTKLNIKKAQAARWRHREARMEMESSIPLDVKEEIKCEEFEVKDEDESEMKVEVEADDGDGDTINEADPLLIDAPTKVTGLRDPLLQGNRCLICFHNDPETFPLKGFIFLPKSKDDVNHPSQVEDDMTIIYLLKMIFQWTTTELSYVMKLSNGQSPREWIHLCQSCRLLIFEIQTLEDRMRECREKIRDMIMKSTEGSSSSMTQKVRSLVKQQVRSSRANTTEFLEGDRQAEGLLMKTDPGMNLHAPDQEMSFQLPEKDFNEGEDRNHNHSLFESSSSSDDDYESYDDNPTTANDLKTKGKEMLKKKCPTVELVVDQVFSCPYGCLDSSMNSEAKTKMNFVEIFHHLIFHYDYPMNCSECSVHLQRDPPKLDAHWQQYHYNIETPREKRFLENRNQVGADLDLPTQLTKTTLVKCVDCNSRKEFKFYNNLHELKLHQALEHPEVARISCPLCLKKFAVVKYRSEVIQNHMETVHGFSWKSYPCGFCGEFLPEDDEVVKEAFHFKKTEKAHMISRHCDLIKGSFTCTLCSQEFLNVKGFIEHGTSTEGHAEMNFDVNAVDLCIISTERTSFSCGLCNGFEVAAMNDFQTIGEFLRHLTQKHSLHFKWRYDLLNPSTPLEIKGKTVVEEPIKETAWQSNAGKPSNLPTFPAPENGPMFHCPACPQLKAMSVDAIIVHLLFHWRKPNKCTLCKVYLPFASEVIENHWKQLHPEHDLSTAVKFEPVSFSPGFIFHCQNCPDMFASSKSRHLHELSHHGSCARKSASCNICEQVFVNTDEVRLHKAIDHPETACLSCHYCEDLFPAESVEGGQYLDSKALQQHILQKHYEPIGKSGIIFCLVACDFCGEVIRETFGRGLNHTRSHVSKVHGKIANQTPFTCFLCNKGVIDLWGHLSTTHAKNCICETCGEEMRPRTLPLHNLDKHGVLMEGYKMLSCKKDGCGYQTVYSSSLRRHVTVNHKKRKRKHKCSVCDKAFYLANYLKEHEERHKNKETRPYQCEICGGSYAVRNDLYIHKRLSHLNLKFPSTNRKRSKKPNPIERKTASDQEGGHENGDHGDLVSNS